MGISFNRNSRGYNQFEPQLPPPHVNVSFSNEDLSSEQMAM
jgi:hypothetical protein